MEKKAEGSRLKAEGPAFPAEIDGFGAHAITEGSLVYCDVFRELTSMSHCRSARAWGVPRCAECARRNM